ncbi:MAG: phosphopantetheine-binding protein [Nitrosospira sp.]
MATELEILCDYIRTEMGHDGNLDPDVDLLEAKILDSFNIVELAVFIQERFQIELEAEDVVRTNLSTLSSMISLIKMRRIAENHQN